MDALVTNDNERALDETLELLLVLRVRKRTLVLRVRKRWRRVDESLELLDKQLSSTEDGEETEKKRYREKRYTETEKKRRRDDHRTDFLH